MAYGVKETPNVTYEPIRKALDNQQVVILDGAMGTELQRRGSKQLGSAWAASANLVDPEIVRSVYADYIGAGADVISTNTFGASRLRLGLDGLSEQTAQINQRAVELAIEAREQARATGKVAIAGAMTTVLARTGSGRLDPPLDEAHEVYLEQAQMLASAGVDLLLLEMVKEPDHAKTMLAAAHEAGLPVWVGFACKVVDGVASLVSDEPGRSLDEALEVIGPMNADVVTIMHTNVEDVGASLGALNRHWSGPTGTYPHSGKWLVPDWAFDESATPAVVSEAAVEWKAQGATVFGTCCGMGVEHIAALSARLR